MHIKRFEAASMLEAVRKVKEELGPDALVLSTRTAQRKSGPFGLFGRPVVEVTAAVDREARGGEAPERAPADPSWRHLRVTKALVDPLECELRELRRAVEGLARPVMGGEELARDLSELRRVTADLASRWRSGAEERSGAQIAYRLLDAGLSPRHAFALGEEVGRETDEAGPRSDVLCQALARRLDARLLPPRDDEAPRVTFFVGPTGVGKTTSLAKLAARGGSEDIAVVTTDGFRLGAEEQLRTFANLLQVPFGVAVSPEDLGARLSASGQRRVLVDTAGRSPRDSGSLAELCSLRERAGRDARVHLVLSATTGRASLRAELERHRPLRPDSLIIAKLDESEALGELASLLLDGDTPPLAWLGTGQRVPEDLAAPDPLELAGRVLGVSP